MKHVYVLPTFRQVHDLILERLRDCTLDYEVAKLTQQIQDYGDMTSTHVKFFSAKEDAVRAFADTVSATVYVKTRGAEFLDGSGNLCTFADLEIDVSLQGYGKLEVHRAHAMLVFYEHVVRVLKDIRDTVPSQVIVILATADELRAREFERQKTEFAEAVAQTKRLRVGGTGRAQLRDACPDVQSLIVQQGDKSFHVEKDGSGTSVLVRRIA